MSGLSSPTQPGRSSVLALVSTLSIVCAGSIQPANAASPSTFGLSGGSISALGSNTAWASPSIPQSDRINFQDYYNQLSATERSIVGLISFGSFGLIAAFRPLDSKFRRSYSN